MEILDNSRLAVVLVSPRNTLNIGAVARAMSNFGCSDLRVAAIYYQDFRKASSAVGPSAELLREARDYSTLSEAIADCTLVLGTTGALRPDWPLPYERLEQAALRARAAMREPDARVALLFGSEKFGLSNDDMSHCHALVRIPTRDEHASMNLGQAAAVCLWELSRVSPQVGETQIGETKFEGPQRDGPALDGPRQAAPQLNPWHAGTGTPPASAWRSSNCAPPLPPHPADTRQKRPPTAGELDRLSGLFEEVLLASDYPAMHTRHRSRQLRILARRLGIPAGDATHWTGFLRQILWKLRS